MKLSFIHLTILLVIPFLSVSSTKKLSDTYSQAKIKLEEAVDKRDFSEAKEVLNELMPLMREDLKASKKEIASMKSELDESSLVQLQDTVNRKKEIYNRLHHLINVSPAALRVKSKDVVELVEEFEELGH